MAKAKRNVKFQHRGHGDGRRESFSDMSENASEPGSPTRNGKLLESTREEVSILGS